MKILKNNILESSNADSCVNCPKCGKMASLIGAEIPGWFSNQHIIIYQCRYGCGYEFKISQVIPVKNSSYKMGNHKVILVIGRYLAGMTSAIGSIALVIMLFGIDENGEHSLIVFLKTAYQNIGLIPTLVVIFVLLFIFRMFSKIICGEMD